MKRNAARAAESYRRNHRLRPIADQPGFKGGRWPDERGYLRVAHPSKPGRWVYEHRLVMEQELGRPLQRAEFVHHRNGDKADNRRENLTLFTNGAHSALHRPRHPGSPQLPAGTETRFSPCLCGCEILVPLVAANGRRREGYVNGHNWRGKRRGS